MQNSLIEFQGLSNIMFEQYQPKPAIVIARGFDVILFVICGLFPRKEKDILKILANGLVHGGLAVARPSFQERHPHTLMLPCTH